LKDVIKNSRCSGSPELNRNHTTVQRSFLSRKNTGAGPAARRLRPFLPTTNSGLRLLAEAELPSPANRSPPVLIKIGPRRVAISSFHHVEQPTASTGIGSGAPSSAEMLCGAQQAFPRRARSACIAFSCPITASVSRRIRAAPALAGFTIL